MQYAVCPQCDNPIQILGLYRLVPGTKQPYGRHYPHSVEKLAAYDQEAYEFCPFARKSRTLAKHHRKEKLDGLPAQILYLLQTQFDRIVYILSGSTDMRFSEKLLRSMLTRYFSEEGYLYTGATINNLPWIFGYMSDAQSLYGQLIRRDSELHKAIAAECAEADFLTTGSSDYVQIVRKPGMFLDLNFSFIIHKCEVVDDEVKETLYFDVHQGQGTPPKVLYRKVIEFDNEYFLRLINLPANRSYRNEKHLELAREVICQCLGKLVNKPAP